MLAGYLFKFNKRNTRKRCDMFNDVILVSSLLTKNILDIFFNTFFADFEQVNLCWVPHKTSSYLLEPVHRYWSKPRGQCIRFSGFVLKCVMNERSRQGGSVEKMFLEISQNSKKNTCASLFLNKVAGLGLFIK